jgi:hypothetical protein
MKRKQLYIARLVAGITVAALFALACSALLDMGSLNSKASKEAGGPDYTGDFKLPIDKPTVIPDTGKCVTGSTCATGLKGICAVGKAVCYDGSATGSCTPTAKYTEICDGKDSNCDGVADTADPLAKADCVAKKQYCNGTACVVGCYTVAECTQSNTCNTTTHKCACGTANACTAPKICVPASNKCVCGSTGKLECGSGETCDDNAGAGKCTCGTVSSTTGRACAAGESCKGTGTAAVCTLNPNDIGPDKPKTDQGSDLPPVDKGLDKTVVDQKIIDKSFLEPPPPKE